MASASILTDNMTHFDSTQSHLMSFYQLNLIPQENAEATKAKLVLLVHNLSGFTLDDSYIQGILAEIEHKLEILPQETAPTAIMYII